MTNSAINFNSDVIHNIELTGTDVETKRRDCKNPINLVERI